jgi:hypothetical protein
VVDRQGPWRLVAGVRLADATHPTDLGDPAVLGAALAGLWAACPRPDLIVVHGAGTRAGDRYEAAALEQGPWSGCRRLAMKPVIGHTLGASGLVELGAALAAPAGVDRIWKLAMGFGGHVAGTAVVRHDVAAVMRDAHASTDHTHV